MASIWEEDVFTIQITGINCSNLFNNLEILDNCNNLVAWRPLTTKIQDKYQLYCYFLKNFELLVV